MAFSAGQILTATALNDRIPESSRSTWTTPISSGITVGAGTTQADFFQVGPMTFCFFRFVLAGDSSIDGSVALDLPVDSFIQTSVAGSGIAYDASAGIPHLLGIVQAGVADLVIFRTTGATSLSSTVPFTWAVNDRLTAAFWYFHE